MPATIVVGAQWGDEGKGKIVDLLAAEHDWVVRYQGGANAGHSVIHDGKTVVLRLLPSGILRSDKKCVIANGVVVDPEALVEELDELAGLGVSAEGRLFVSDSAHLILPYHRLADRAREEGPNAVGTTKRGIGPAYEDKAARIGVRVGALLDADELASGVREVRAHAVKRVGDRVELPAVDEVVAHYRALGERVSSYITETRALLWDAIDRGDRVLLEGAQGTLLDVDHGTYPFVTSSNAGAGGALPGAGIGPRSITRVIGVAKAYTTRVGLGPFPTELTGEMGSYIREAGDEYGAVTGRPRRCGWLDAVALRYAVRLNGLDELMITKLDVLDGVEKVGIAVGYRIGERSGDRFVNSIAALERVEPEYEWHAGWKSSTRDARSFGDLPQVAQEYLRRAEELAGVRISRVSVGPGRTETIPVGKAGVGAAG